MPEGEIVDEDGIDSVPRRGAVASRPKLRGPLLIAAPVVVAIGALAIYLTGGRYETTDNAELQAGLVGIAADTSGKVIEIDVHENQFVHQGDVLFRIDPATAMANLAAAQATLATARAGVGADRASYDQSAADVPAARARYKFALAEAARQKSLLAEGISSRAQYDQAALTAQTAKDAITAVEAKAESQRAALQGNLSGPVDRTAAVQQAAAALQTAQIMLNHTVVRAPRDGVVTKVNQIQLGSYVTASRPVFMLAGTKFWVEANFKENQLRYMRVGQTAKVTIDAFPDLVLKGRVASFSPGTGNSFSILPAENATGNWVKVVQRLTVQIALDSVPTNLPLHAGLSTSVEIDTGHKRSLFGKDTPPSEPGRPAATP